MSLLRRKRRQNRIAQQAIPATRNARTFLDFASRGLRKEPNFKTLSPRETKKLGLFTGLVNKPIPRWAINRELELDELRKQSHYREVMNKTRLKPKTIRKPIYNLQLDGTVRVDLPPEHPICRQRQERREVLFAKGGTGSGQKPRRKDNNIKIRCEK